MILRNAGFSDRQLFFDLRNDADAVRFSYTKRGVTWYEHNVWWDSTSDQLFVAETRCLKRPNKDMLDYLETDYWDDKNWENRKVGYVRLTPIDESTCELHFAVTPEERGKGWAVEMLAEARTVAADLGYKHIIARVDVPNTPSIRAFLREGYQITSAGTLFLERNV